MQQPVIEVDLISPMKDSRLPDFEKLPGWAKNLIRAVLIIGVLGWVVKWLVE